MFKHMIFLLEILTLHIRTVRLGTHKRRQSWTLFSARNVMNFFKPAYASSAEIVSFQNRRDLLEKALA